MAFTIFNHICNEAEGNRGGYLMAMVRRTAETKKRKRKGAGAGSIPSAI